MTSASEMPSGSVSHTGTPESMLRRARLMRPIVMGGFDRRVRALVCCAPVDGVETADASSHSSPSCSCSRLALVLLLLLLLLVWFLLDLNGVEQFEALLSDRESRREKVRLLGGWSMVALAFAGTLFLTEAEGDRTSSVLLVPRGSGDCMAANLRFLLGTDGGGDS